MRTIKTMLIELGQLERLYTGKTTLYLWRGLSHQDYRENPLYPDFQSRALKTGQTRAADVTVTTDHQGVDYVIAEVGRGTSLTDKFGIFGTRDWDYVSIPAGTEIPAELSITKDYFWEKKRCWHFTISPSYNMPVALFIAALDQLALNARIQSQAKRNA